MKCPKCNSENVQKLSVIYESGTHNIDTQSDTVGGGFAWGSGGGSVFTGGATTRTSGTQQSILADRATPPQKRSYILCFVFFVGGFALMYIEVVLWGILFVIGSIVWGYFVHQYNTSTWQKLYNDWSASWHCNRCGELYLF